MSGLQYSRSHLACISLGLVQIAHLGQFAFQLTVPGFNRGEFLFKRLTHLFEFAAEIVDGLGESHDHLQLHLLRILFLLARCRLLTLILAIRLNVVRVLIYTSTFAFNDSDDGFALLTACIGL